MHLRSRSTVALGLFVAVALAVLGLALGGLPGYAIVVSLVGLAVVIPLAATASSR